MTPGEPKVTEGPWLAIGYGEDGAETRIVHSDAEMVQWLWEQCGLDHTGDEASTRAFWAALVADVDEWRRCDGVPRWWLTIDIGETGHIAFIALLGATAALSTRVRELEAALEMMYDKYEDGSDCYEEPETFGGYIGKAVQISDEEEKQILKLIPSESAALLPQVPTNVGDGK